MSTNSLFFIFFSLEDFAYVALSLKIRAAFVRFEDLWWREGRTAPLLNTEQGGEGCAREWRGESGGKVRVKRLVCLCGCMCVDVCVRALGRLLLWGGGGGGWLPVGPASQCNWKMWPGKCLPSGAWKLPPRWRWRAQRRLTWPLTGRACYWVGAHVKSHFIPSPHTHTGKKNALFNRTIQSGIDLKK